MPADPAANAAPQPFGYGDWQTHAALLIFAMVWFFIARDWKKLPIGKTAGALFGAALMVQIGVITAQQANSSIHVTTIFLLMGLMLILAMLEEKGFVDAFTRLLTGSSPSAVGLLVRVSLLSGVASAFIMNDGAVILLAAVVTEVCGRHGLPPGPFYMALATSSNIGSAATVVGNPKNMVIQDMTDIGFVSFARRMVPPAVVGLLLNTAFLVLYYGKELKGQKIMTLPGSKQSKLSQNRTAGSQEASSAGGVSEPDEDDDEDEDDFDEDTLTAAASSPQRPSGRRFPHTRQASEGRLERLGRARGHFVRRSKELLHRLLSGRVFATTAEATAAETTHLLATEIPSTSHFPESFRSLESQDTAAASWGKQKNPGGYGALESGELRLQRRFSEPTDPSPLSVSSPSSASPSVEDVHEGPMSAGGGAGEGTSAVAQEQRRRRERLLSEADTEPFVPRGSLSLVIPRGPGGLRRSSAVVMKSSGALGFPSAQHTPQQSLSRDPSSGRIPSATEEQSGVNDRLESPAEVSPTAQRPGQWRGGSLILPEKRLESLNQELRLRRGGVSSGDNSRQPSSLHSEEASYQQPFFPGLGGFSDWDVSRNAVRLAQTQQVPYFGPAVEAHLSTREPPGGLTGADKGLRRGSKAGMIADISPALLPSLLGPPLRLTELVVFDRDSQRLLLKEVATDQTRYESRVKEVLEFLRVYKKHFAMGVIVFFMYLGFFYGMDLGWTCLTAALCMVIVRRRQATGLFEKQIDWRLLLYLIALFVNIAGVNQTVVPGGLWDLVRPLVTHPSTSISVFGFCSLVLLLSLIFTSIPSVLLISPHLMQLTSPLAEYGWLLLAWCVSLAGNVTVFSSVAGVIVSRHAANTGSPISFMEWFRYTFPSTVLCMSVGAIMIASGGPEDS